MKIKDRISKAYAGFRGKLISDGQLLDDSFGLANIFSFGTEPKRTTSEFLKSATGWVYACVDAIAKEIGSIQLHLFEVKGQGNVKEVDDHDILNLLHRANDNTTKFDLFYLTQQYLDLTGEAPWYLQFENGKPVNIFLLRPDRITPLPPKEDGQIIGGYTYKVFDEKGGYKEIILEPIEVIFLKYPDPDKALRGKGSLQAVMRAYDIDETSERYNLKFFQNSASPNAIFSTDKKLGKEKLNKLRKDLSKKYDGWENAHKTVILEGGLKYDKMALTQKEMDFIESMKFTRDKILAIFRVPKTVLGIVEDVNRSNAEASDYVFASRTIKPKMQMLIEQLNEFLVPLFDDSGKIFLDYDDPVPENIELKLKQSQTGVQAGYLTVNEARAIQGYDEIEGGDELKQPFSFGGELLEGKKVKRVKKKTPYSRNLKLSGAGKRRHTFIKTKALEKAKYIVEKQVKQIVKTQLMEKAKANKALLHTLKQKAFSKKAKTREQEEDLFQQKQLRVGAENEPEYIRKLVSIFRSQKKKALDNWNSQQKAVGDKYLLDEQEEIAITINKMTPVELKVIAEQSLLAFQLLGIDDKLSLRVPAVQKFLEKHMFKLSKDLTKETNKRLGKIISDSVRNGDGSLVTSQKIGNLFEDMEKHRTLRIARTEVSQATTFATEESYIQSGVVEAKRWKVNPNENTDDACYSMNGKIIGLGRNYFKKGDKFENLRLDYRDIDGPPLHANCQCSLLPVVIT
jgi:HK97 family phage portal protein